MNGKIDYNELIGEGEKGMVSVFQETWNERRGSYGRIYKITCWN